ncbi:hypothetical protein PR202_gb02520 [Eleusine coracana subsp. coracana]|uniref:Retinoblastoma-associated protein A-box domain-containing protein n=1 Tax=Eleusine coracana subsp. coracana TaxID=191504 RepID=A0AAV5E0C3_ELECO|nr:hypothetical protein PR202_gb02520 [Eleusine coracana subsp. coracana]
MEGAATPSSSGSGATDGGSAGAAATAAAMMEERFADLCKSKLELDENITRQAMQLFKETKNIVVSSMSSLVSGSLMDVSPLPIGCVYSLRRSRSPGPHVFFTVYQSLAKQLSGFFKDMKQFCIKAGHVLTGLYGSDWEKRLESEELRANVTHLEALSRFYKRSYEELFQSNVNLEVMNTDHFTCLQAVLIIHIPARLRNFNIKDSSCFGKKSVKGVNLIASLSEKYGTSEDELSKVLEMTNTLIMDILKKKPCLPASEYQQDSLSSIDPEGLIVFEDLLQEDSLRSSLLVLEKEYETINTKGDLDERVFANDEVSLLGSESISGGAIYLPGTKRKYDAMASPAKSITSPSPISESQVLSGNNLTLLLSNERFHRCMLACSAELVLATHKSVTMMFPAVLEKTGITAFDLSKVIEGFVRHEDTLPRELKRHLNSLEERLLESMAWEKGSSMYNSLIVARPALSSEINRLCLLAEPMPSLDAIAAHHNISLGGLPPLPFQKQEHSPDKDEIRSPKRACSERRNVLVDSNSFRSPVKDILKSKLLPPLQSAFASPTRPNPAAGGETCAESGIGVFFSKIAKLAAIRIRSLCERLQLSQQLLEQITQLDLTFKEIIYGYRKQPQCKPQKIGEEHIDIITFYNEVFIPAIKPLLAEVVSGASPNKKDEEKGSVDGQFPESPRLARFPNLPDMSPKKVSATRNVYVSPLRPSKKDALLSPSSKSYYACVGESTYAFQSPSKDLKAINNHLNSPPKNMSKKKLSFDVVSDLVVARSLSSDQNASPATMEVDHVKTPVKYEPSEP